MKPENQRIAIAEACGWHEIVRPCDDAYHFLPTETLERLNGRVGGIKANWVHVENAVPLPDYLNDLNAMHEAEKTLTDDQLIDYAEWLGVCFDENPSKACVVLLRANAAQRAEAFLRTIGKWEE